MTKESYDPDCVRCPRLATFLEETRARYPDYWAHPVPSFGDEAARLLIVGLAPGMHGANRTGRPFTGDHAGILLYQCLSDAGLASAPVSVSSRGWPQAQGGAHRQRGEVRAAAEQAAAAGDPHLQCVPGAGAARTQRRARAAGARAHRPRCGLAGARPLPGPPPLRARQRASPERRQVLIDSYHCSRYNTQTRRLTPEMFRAVLARACELAQLPVPAALRSAKG